MHSPVSFSFQPCGVGSRALNNGGSPALNIGGNPPDVRYRLLSVSQRFLLFIQRFLACVQLRFPLSKLLFSGQILFLAGANHRKRDEHRKGKKFFHIRSKLQLIFRNSDKENGRPTASQTKLNAGSESGICGGCGFLREFFRTFADLLKRLQGRCYRENGVVVVACPQPHNSIRFHSFNKGEVGKTPR